MNISQTNTIVLSGKAGCGKSDLLHALRKHGEQVLDLEHIACHRGSVFGCVPHSKQPSHRSFCAAIKKQMQLFDSNKRIWLEDEGPFIGSVGIPGEIFSLITSSPHIQIVSTQLHRVNRLMAAYFKDIKDFFYSKLDKIKNRLGVEMHSNICTLWDKGMYNEVVTMLLAYYDNAYENRVKGYTRICLDTIDTSKESINQIVTRLCDSGVELHSNNFPTKTSGQNSCQF